MGNELVLYSMDDKMIQLVKDSIAKEATDTELALFIQQCNRTQLDPFAKQIYLVPRWDSKLGREVRTTQVSIDGLRLVAQRSQEYEGQTDVLWCGSDGLWNDVWLKKEHPYAAKIGIFRAGNRDATWATALWDEYVVYTGKGDTRKMSPFWAGKPALMIGKCAEALAMRKTFPMELSGLYIPEEMGEDERPTRAPRTTRKRGASKQAAVTDSDGTVRRSAPVVADEPTDGGEDTTDADIMATDDELNRLEADLHDLSPEAAAKVADEWRAAGIPPLSHPLTQDDVTAAFSIIDRETRN